MGSISNIIEGIEIKPQDSINIKSKQIYNYSTKVKNICNNPNSYRKLRRKNIVCCSDKLELMN
jgi:hypothetical protein